MNHSVCSHMVKLRKVWHVLNIKYSVKGYLLLYSFVLSFAATRSVVWVKHPIGYKWFHLHTQTYPNPWPCVVWDNTNNVTSSHRVRQRSWMYCTFLKLVDYPAFSKSTQQQLLILLYCCTQLTTAWWTHQHHAIPGRGRQGQRPQRTLCGGHSVATFCFVFFWKFWLPIGQYSCCSIRSTAGRTWQKTLQNIMT